MTWLLRVKRNDFKLQGAVEGGCVRHGGQPGRRGGSAVKEKHLAPSAHGGKGDPSDSHMYPTQLKNNNNGIYFFKKSHRREFPDGSALSPGSTGDEVGEPRSSV